MPAGRFSVPVDQPVSVLELLVEGRGVEVRGGGLARQEEVSLEGRSFERFLGQELPAGSAFTLSFGGSPIAAGRLRQLIIIGLAGTALTLGVLWGRRRQPGQAAEPVYSADELARAIAALDAVHERAASTADAATVAHYQRQRSELKRQLVAVLAVAEEESRS
jgi:hypothetical protein